MYQYSEMGIEARLMNVKKKIKKVLDEESDPHRRFQLCEALSNWMGEEADKALIDRDRAEYLSAHEEELDEDFD